MINNTDDIFFAFPETDSDITGKNTNGLIAGKSESPYNHDGGINPDTGQGYKISDGWSVTITKTGEIDKNGNLNITMNLKMKFMVSSCSKSNC